MKARSRCAIGSICLNLICVALFVTAAASMACENYDEALYTASTVNLSNASGVAAWADLAYVAADEQGLVVLDVSYPDLPQLVGIIDIENAAVGAWCSSERLLVLDALNELHVMALPLDMAAGACASLTLPVTVADMVVVGHYAYIAWREGYSDGGLMIIDVTDPASPQIVGQLSIAYAATAVDVSGTLAGLAVYDYFHVIDVANPENPTLQGSLNAGGFGGLDDVVLRGDRAYLSEYFSSIQIVDLSDPSLPQWDGEYSIPETTIRHLAITDNYLLVASTFSSFCHLYAIDLDAEDTPAKVATTVTPGGELQHFVTTGGTVLMACGDDGVTVAVFDPAAVPERVTSVALASWVRGLVARGSHVYAALGNADFQIVDVSNPTLPELAGCVPLPVAGWAVALAGPLALVAAGDDGLFVVDISNPDQPVHAGTVMLPEAAYDVCVVGNYAYVAAGMEGLQVVDVSQPDAWPIVAAEPTIHEVYGVAQTGNLVLLASDLLLEVFDVSDPEAPVYQGWSDLTMMSGTNGLTAQSNYAYVMHHSVHAWLSYDIGVYDLSDPTSPDQVGGRPVPSSSGALHLSGDYAYLPAGGGGGLLVLDLSDPAAPRTIGSLPGPAGRVTVAHDEYIYFGAGSGLGVAWRQCGDITAVEPQLPTVASGPALAVWPNPFNPRTTVSFALPHAGWAKLGIYDLAGQRVDLLADRFFAAGEHVLDWQGRDAAGRALPSGTYFVRLTTESAVQTEKLSLIR